MVHILFTADQKYAVRIPTVINSIRINHPDKSFCIHVISDDISEMLENKLVLFCEKYKYTFRLYRVDSSLFCDAPVNKHYSKAMYYRMLASDILPDTIDRVLYLDPDVLIINSLMPLWEMDLEGYTFAASSHVTEAGIVDNINRARLDISSLYYNTGVLLMNLKSCRQIVSSDTVLKKIQENKYKLLLPDQDIFNSLYGEKTKSIPDEIWNYDVRKYSQYLRKSIGVMDEYWVIRNTAVLHYCGKEKPWNSKYQYRFGDLYRHYEHLCEKEERGI